MNQINSNLVKQNPLNTKNTNQTSGDGVEKQFPLLPRAGWKKDSQALAKILLKTKLLLDISEIDYLVSRK